MRRRALFFTCFLLLLAAFSCHNKDNATSTIPNNPNQVSPNMVNIPATAGNTSSNGKIAKMVFADTNYDFGDITAGDKVSHVFLFKNRGNGDLIISGASASCGCTKPYYPHDVKHPGDTGTISVTFDSSNKEGKILKTITISSNSQPPYRFLTITANIKPSNN
jgi:hypothetical protein